MPCNLCNNMSFCLLRFDSNFLDSVKKSSNLLGNCNSKSSHSLQIQLEDLIDMSHVARKPAFGVPDQVKNKPAYKVSEED